MHEAKAIPLTLAHRLQIESTPNKRGTSAVLLGIVLGLLAWMVILFDSFLQEEHSVRLIVIGTLACLGLLLIYSGFYQLLAAKIPVTTVEVSKSVFDRGKVVNLFFRQPGPINLKSLRANLAGEEVWWSVDSEGDRTRNTRYLGAFNCFDSGPQKIAEDQPFEATISFKVPIDIPASGRTADKHQVIWKIEVWGNVRGYVNFYHSYPVVVG